MSADYLLTLKEIGNDSAEYIETLFALSNGHLGVRASAILPTKEGAENPGTFINGFHDTHPIGYGEWAYGYAKNHQTIVKLPDIRSIVIEIDNEKSSESDWAVIQTDFVLDMETGLLEESYEISTLGGKKFILSVCSFLSFKYSELSVFHYTIKPLNFSGDITISKVFENERKSETVDSTDPRVASSKSELAFNQIGDSWVEIATEFSGQAVLFSQVFETESNHKKIAGSVVSEVLEVKENQESLFTSYVLFSAILDKKDKENINQIKATLTQMRQSLDFVQLLEEQKQQVKDFWQSSDIVITGNEVLQKGIRFNLFHLYQNAGRDGKTNFAAKGLTGEGYEGHYFWDTEMYILPFFIYTQPEIAKELLRYRVSILPKAKERAKEMAQKDGALFAWRTINGEEASAYYPAGTAQLHINADIAYAFQLYERVTGDHTFINRSGAQVIFETARFWVNYGNWIETKTGKKFCINGVTGPDEYTALVNNNYYTNKMAQNNLNYGVELAKRLGTITEFEWQTWQAAAEGMKLPYDQEKQLIKQDDTFFEKAPWPFAETPKDKYPLLLHYHPMVIYKHQVSKQADGLLAEMLFPQDYSQEQMLRDYHFYEKVTTHDSSLSRSIFSILASRTKQLEKAYAYFMDTALMDLTDLQGNAKDGIHAANMGGSWLSIIYGFAGLTYENNEVHIANNLPKEIEALDFKLNLRGTLVDIHIDHQKISLNSLENKDQLKIKQQTAENAVIVLG